MTVSVPTNRRAFEQYSQAIFELQENGVRVIQARIAEHLGISRPAVSEMIGDMQREKLVKLDAKGRITLTAKGRRIAMSTVRRHRVAERFLTDILDLPLSRSYIEADRWESVISPEVEERMVALLQNPTECPHGNPIPGSGHQLLKTIALTDVEEGTEFTIIRIPTKICAETDHIEYLERSGITPGERGRLESVAPDGTLVVRVGTKSVGLGDLLATKIQVMAL